MSNPITLTGGPAAPPAPKMFRTLGISASGLSAQRARMETIATNIANAETTRTPDGGAYRRRVVQLEPGTPAEFASTLAAANPLAPADVAEVAVPLLPFAEAPASLAYGTRVGGIAEDPTDGPRVYQPGHPDADADGYVTYPNVRVTDEIVDLMDARRLFEANATVFQAAKSMLRRSIDI